MDKITELFNSSQTDAILVSSAENMRYLSGFSGGVGCLLLMRDHRYLLTDSRYTLMAKTQAKGFCVLEIQGEYAARVAELCREASVRTLAFENLSMMFCAWAEFQKALEGIALVPIETRLDDLRIVKTPQEIEWICQAEAVGDRAFDRILEDIRPGVSELEIAAQLEYYLKTLGGEALSFDTIVASGENSAMPHAIPTHKKIRAGEFITMDFGCKVHGYCSDMTRTVVLGHADEDQKRLYQTVLDAQMRALDAVCAGKTGQEIDAIARKQIDHAGYAGKFGHGLGHGVGLAIHEAPRVSKTGSTSLPENTVVTIEPGIYLDGLYGVRIEDVVVVLQGGCTNLTHAPKKLIEL